MSMNKIKMLVASAAMFSALSSFAVADVSGVAVANIDSFSVLLKTLKPHEQELLKRLVK